MEQLKREVKQRCNNVPISPPEGMDIDAAGISVTVGVSYPRRSVGLPRDHLDFEYFNMISLRHND